MWNQDSTLRKNIYIPLFNQWTWSDFKPINMLRHSLFSAFLYVPYSWGIQLNPSVNLHTLGLCQRSDPYVVQPVSAIASPMDFYKIFHVFSMYLLTKHREARTYYRSGSDPKSAMKIWYLGYLDPDLDNKMSDLFWRIQISCFFRSDKITMKFVDYGPASLTETKQRNIHWGWLVGL